MTRAILVKVRRFRGWPIGQRRTEPATPAALALPVADRCEVRALAFVLAGATAEPDRDETLERIARHKCGAGDSGLTRYARRAHAAGQVKRMRGPTAAESRSIAARLEAAGGL